MDEYKNGCWKRMSLKINTGNGWVQKWKLEMDEFKNEYWKWISSIMDTGNGWVQKWILEMDGLILQHQIQDNTYMQEIRTFRALAKKKIPDWEIQVHSCELVQWNVPWKNGKKLSANGTLPSPNYLDPSSPTTFPTHISSDIISFCIC